MICKNCGKEIDDKAVVCVHCWKKVKKKTFNPILILPIALILFIIMTLSLCSGDGTTVDTDNEDKTIISATETTKDTSQETTDQTTLSSETTETTTDTTVETTVKATKTPVTETKPDTNKKPAATEAEKPKHTHSFSAATCTTPKTCSCGATEGKANGHSWKSATCTSPKTCTVCGTTSGSTSSHNYSAGKCTNCGAKDPNYTTTTYILNTKSMKFHRTTCHKLPTDNRANTTMSRQEIINSGYEPCKICNP